jgi:hypothetical protein
MKSKSASKKSNFVKIVVLLLLVLGVATGVLLATQKRVFDEPEASGSCGCKANEDLGKEKCVSNSVYTCSVTLGRYYYKQTQSCSRTNQKCENSEYGCFSSCTNANLPLCDTDGDIRCGSSTMIQRCTNGVWTDYKDCDLIGKMCLRSKCVSNYLPQVSPNSTPTSPSIPAGYCEYDCSTRYECNNDGGTIVGGRCGTGEVCCKF